MIGSDAYVHRGVTCSCVTLDELTTDFKDFEEYPMPSTLISIDGNVYKPNNKYCSLSPLNRCASTAVQLM